MNKTLPRVKLHKLSSNFAHGYMIAPGPRDKYGQRVFMCRIPRIVRAPAQPEQP